MTAPDAPFRAQCASCMQVSFDPTAVKCPGCGSKRLVVHVGKRAEVTPAKVVVKRAHRKVDPPEKSAVVIYDRRDPQPIGQTCTVCGAPPGTACDMKRHNKRHLYRPRS